METLEYLNGRILIRNENNIPIKRECKTCGIVKACTDFTVQTHMSLGIHNSCKFCTRIKDEKRKRAKGILERKVAKTRLLANGEIEKTCMLCDEYKALDAFGRAGKNALHGRNSKCKECTNAARLALSRLNGVRKKDPEVLFKRDGSVLSKACPGCSQVLPADSFGVHKSGFHGLRSRCQECEHEVYLLKKYNIAIADKQSMFLSQDGKCGICQESFQIKKLVVDHCHGTNSIRGLLCLRCNCAIGLFSDDNQIIIQRAAGMCKYIENSTNVSSGLADQHSKNKSARKDKRRARAALARQTASAMSN